MKDERESFWPAVILGFIVMLLLAVLTVNILDLIPVLGPIAGGIVAGFVAGKDFVNGSKAGLASGMLGTAAVLIDFFLKTGYLESAIPRVPEVMGAYFLLFAMVMYFPILAFIGGAIGGAMRRAMGRKSRS